MSSSLQGCPKGKSSSPEDLSVDDRMRFARLIRTAREHGLDEDTRHLLRDLLIQELGLSSSERAEPERAESLLAEAPTSKAADSVPQDTAPMPQVVTQPPPAAAGRAQLHQLELKIRQLVDADAAWTMIEPHALELFEMRRDAETAARVLELAFLHGHTADIESMLVRLKVQAQGFYRHVHPAVRAHLVARLWQEDTSDTLATIIFRVRDEDWIQPIERLFVLESMRGSRDATAPFMFFRRYRQELCDAVETIGPHLGITRSAFLLAMGQMALDLGYGDEARKLLGEITIQDAEYDEALRLLLSVAVERNKSGRSHYVELLLSQESSSGRLSLLAQFFSATRGLGGFKDRNRPALNEILKNPLEWVSAKPEDFSELSELIVANRDLDVLLPNLYEVFRENARRFAAPPLDQALWKGSLGLSVLKTPRDLYWYGVALLHHYIATGPANEEALWQAWDYINQARKAQRQAVVFEWRELHKAAFAHVAKTHYILETDRVRMLRQLRVAVDPETVATADIEEYIDQTATPPVKVLTGLEQAARSKGAAALTLKVLLKRAYVTHLTNQDLDTVFRLACEREDSDLAWRAATILSARGALAPQVRHAWGISGEKRSEYSFMQVTKPLMAAAFSGLSPQAQRLAHGCLAVGPELPALLAILDRQATIVKASQAPHDSLESKIEKYLSSLKLFGSSKRRYRFYFENSLASTSVPGFMQVLPSNLWSVLVAALADRLGINAWNWRLSRLANQIVDLIPRLASRQDLKRHSGRVAQWLKELAPEQRSAWQDLAGLARNLADEDASIALASFICRLASLMHQNHFLALTSLQAMRAPVSVLWDLEVWLLSDAYSELRREMGSVSRVPVPHSLRRLTSIVQEVR